jgi:glycosyltransferase involved in cell wall biosynthesis
MITVVMTSYNRRDLLQKTVESFLYWNDYPVKEFIIIEDSGNKDMHQWLINYVNSLMMRMFSGFCVIINPENIGAYESIDLAYSQVKTPYVCHFEDDWEFTSGGFLEPALKVLQKDASIMQVNFSNEQKQPIELARFYADGVKYQIVGTDINGWWHGFTCNPSLRSMAGYEATKPWTQWSTKEDDLSIREVRVGMRYFVLGYKAAVLDKYFCKHIGEGRGTWQR